MILFLVGWSCLCVGFVLGALWKWAVTMHRVSYTIHEPLSPPERIRRQAERN